jgi:4-hydroxy-tetrahydrodipicolinate synthase
MVTPFDAFGRVDEQATVQLMHHLVEHGSDGLVVCGTTGEAATLDDEEHLRVIELAVEEMKPAHPRCKIVAGVGSNDTRHAVKLTERATEIGPDALLSVNPYYNRPTPRGLILLYNIPQRTGQDLSNEFLAELAQIEHIVGVKQANPANLAKVDGLEIYAGNDDMLADVLDLGEPGGILTSTHVFGDVFRRMVDEPEHRREIHNSFDDVYRDMGIAPAAVTNKAALNLIGVQVGGPRLPYVELDDSETQVIRSLLERHRMLVTTA